jgi:hypothetical protein
MYKKIIVSFAIILAGVIPLVAQSNVPNPVQSAVPFVTLAPDSRGGAMGDAGVATSPDINSMHWNPAKFAFLENEAGISASYTPWLRNLVGDIDLAYLTGFYKLDHQQVLAASLRFFSLGEIEFRNSQGDYIMPVKPSEFAIDLAYSRKFSDKISGAIAFRYINSNLSKGVAVNGVDTKAAQAFAADISMYYVDDVKISDMSGKMAFGVNISNIGNKVTYTTDLHKDFIPTNLKIGGSLSLDINSYNSMTFTTDLNKLLVPTTPVYYPDSTDADGNKVIEYGKNPDVGLVQGIFQSFSDAPGVIQSNGKRSVLKEEFREITYSVGIEYWYRKQFALRGGFFYENPTKGNRKFFTMGVGLKLNVFGIDFSYLVPTNSYSPLANTLRFTLSFDFDAFRKLKNT